MAGGDSIEIGIGKSGRRAYALDDIAIVPSRRTRDPEDVSLAWEIDAYRFELPLVASAMDGVVSPETAVQIGRLGGLGVLNLEGLWTRYDDPTPLLAEIGTLPDDRVGARMREIYAKPIEESLIKERIQQIREAGVTVAASLTPQRTVQFAQTVIDSGVDLFVIQGTVVSAEHVSSYDKPLDLNAFVESLDIPFGAVTTDLENGTEVWLRRGSLRTAVRASISVPAGAGSTWGRPRFDTRGSTSSWRKRHRGWGLPSNESDARLCGSSLRSGNRPDRDPPR